MMSLIRRLFGQKSDAPSISGGDPTEVCNDCGAKNGELHDLFCTRERCPFCGNQLITCDCIRPVLQLSPEESQALDEYVDDSKEPLRSVMERWKSALEEKGRIPFRGRRLQPNADDLILMAARGEDAGVIKLLSLGVPVDATNEVNHTSLKAAAWNGQLEMIRLLIDRGADVRHRNAHGFTALHCAVGSPPSDQEHQAKCVQLLLDGGAEVNAIDNSGGTTLMGAAWFDALPSVELLLRAGADATIKDQKGRTARDLAEQRGHVAIASMLQQSEKGKRGSL
jgi:ankyrin repeat protein